MTRPSQNANYSDLFERLRDPSFLLDVEHLTIIDVNPAVEQVLKFKPSDLLGQKISSLCTTQENRAALDKQLRVSRRRYHPRAFDMSWRQNQGALLTFEISACVISTQDGTEFLQVIARDVTQDRELATRAAQYLAQIEKLSRTDELTQIANVRAFREELSFENERVGRYGGNYAIVFCDVDHFKKYNDQNGHPAGDDVLRGVAAIVKECVRNTDTPARYGGEEFVILCRETDIAGARIVAERILKRVSEFAFPHREKQPLGFVSVSIGIASYTEHGKSSDAILKAADEALYESKKNGRNRITIAAVEPISLKKKAA